MVEAYWEIGKEFGKGFTITNLSLSHYRLLMRIEDEARRTIYLNECAESNWSVH